MSSGQADRVREAWPKSDWNFRQQIKNSYLAARGGSTEEKLTKLRLMQYIDSPAKLS